MTEPEQLARATAERVARQSYGRLLAFLVARTRDLAGAEDALAEAFASALQAWPCQGIPARPEAWLLTAARRRQVDALRRGQTRRDGQARLNLISDELEEARMQADAIPDRRLALMFACAHPAIEPAMRAPLILQTILGFTARDIAAAFLLPPATMGQRLVRAKTRLKEADAPFEIPGRDELEPRLDAVLEAIYAAYTRGWAELGDPGRSELAEESIWLGRLVVSLLSQEPEAKGMLALMLYAQARRRARRDAAGAYVPLERQDTSLWDDSQLQQAETLLREASQAGPTGRYQIEAAIQSAHVSRRLSGQSNWPAIVQLYDVLLQLTQSPVVMLNRAAALAETSGAPAALASLDAIAADSRLAQYQPYWALRGHLCARAGHRQQAHEAFTLAIGLASDPAVRKYLLDQHRAVQDD